MLNAAGKKPRINLPSVLLWLLILPTLVSAGAETIIDRELTVLRSDYKEVHYLIPKGTTNARIQGSFKCKGGLNDDVNFLVFTMDQYVRWYSNHKNQPILKMEKKKEGTFEFPVNAEETYYFVFDNFFSTVSNKQVILNAKLVRSNGKE